MKFSNLIQMIHASAENTSFEEASSLLEKKIFELPKKALIPLITEIGIIPEYIPHDSSEEKLYAKVADIVLAKCFQEMGLSANVIKKRTDCADVFAKSLYHSYSLVGDAKAFRLSRTAKNQKDFKVQSMIHWKGDSEFAVLVCPFFQYPRSSSQIYTQALDGNILLWSWEHLSFLLSNDIKETAAFPLKAIWNTSFTVSKQFSRADKKVIFWDKQDALLCKYLNLEPAFFDNLLCESKQHMISRGSKEICYYKKEIEKIKNLTKEQAIKELIAARKIKEKMASIDHFISSLKG